MSLTRHDPTGEDKALFDQGVALIMEGLDRLKRSGHPNIPAFLKRLANDFDSQFPAEPGSLGRA